MEKFKTIETFVKVARLKSFGLAAEQLGSSAGLVSKHVSALERRIGVLLLARTTRSVSLTEDGKRYLEFCTRIFSEFDLLEAELAASNASPAGTLRVMAPKSFGAHHFADAVAQFAKDNLGMTITLILDDAPNYVYDLAEKDIDLAIRLWPMIEQSPMVTRKIGALTWVVCGSPSYFATHGKPTRQEELSNLNCLIHVKLAADRIWRFKNGRSIKVSGTYLSNSDLAIRQAALQGVGIAQLPTYYIASDIREGELIVLGEAFSLEEGDIYAVFPQGHRTPLRVRRFVDFLQKWYQTSPWENPAGVKLRRR